MKIRITRTLALLFLIFVATVATLAYVGIIEAPMARIATNLDLRKTSRVASSQLILEQVRDVLSFHSVEYVYRTVFPHDFYPEDVELQQVLNRLSIDTRPVEEVLSPQQIAYWDAYNLALDVGLRPARDEFIVVTVRAQGGYDLSDENALSENAFTVTEEETAEGTLLRVLTIALPAPEIVDLVVEDVRPEEYRYPEVAVEPEGWQRVAEFVSARVAARTVDEGILDHTQQNSESFLRSLFRQAGYDQVTFE